MRGAFWGIIAIIIVALIGYLYFVGTQIIKEKNAPVVVVITPTPAP